MEFRQHEIPSKFCFENYNTKSTIIILFLCTGRRHVTNHATKLHVTFRRARKHINCNGVPSWISQS